MNPDLQQLQAYPFQRLNELFAGAQPADKYLIKLSIGEPQHPVPDFITELMRSGLSGLASYPLTKGSEALRHSIKKWLQQRYSITDLDHDQHILPVNGTREALFAFAQTIVDRSVTRPLVMMPNPFYQIYEGAALLAGAKPFLMNCIESSAYLPDFNNIKDADWHDCQLLYLCSPGNPTGSVMPIEQMQALITLAHKHNFIIASDECYSEIYRHENKPPCGLLQASEAMGNTSFSRCMVFHSLSKRSNLPGLRSGFVAGDASLISAFHLYRTYHGCAMSPLVQTLSSAAWQDEEHVKHNRQLYRDKFNAVDDILSAKLDLTIPQASFYLWLTCPDMDDLSFTKQLYQQQNVVVLPGSYLSRKKDGVNPGRGYIRIALVEEINNCIEAANRIADTVS